MSHIILSKDDCNFIKSFWDDSISINDKRAIVNIDNTNVLSYKRNAKGGYIDYNNNILIDYILKKISIIGIKSIQTNSVKIAKYSTGDYFSPHHDFNFYRKGAIYKTLVVQLSDSTEYIGGDLCVKDIPQPREQGSYSLFLSSDIHEVKLVENGTRFSLTIFLYETDFINTKYVI
jgi:predicted 2-oxoglutarate/Fe(II)-dependent dioxygenase YbiX